MNNTRTNYLKQLTDYIVISTGITLVALAVAVYMVPCKIVTGSVSGLALLLNELTGISNSTIVLVLNILCLMIGTASLGKKFGIRSIYVSILLPVLIDLFEPLGNMPLRSDNLFINVTCFLILLTIGQCLLFVEDTASGGLDTIAEVIAKYTHNSIGTMVGLIGILVAILTINVYGLQSAMIGAIVTALNGLLINVVISFDKISLPIRKKILQQ